MIDFCDFNSIYNNEYQYSLPQTVLESFMSGVAFDRKEEYTSEEIKVGKEDINTIGQNIISKMPAQEKKALISAGAPGSGKTIQLKKSMDESYAYICPDDVCLKALTGYKNDIKNNEESFEILKAAYDDSRPLSNAATHFLLAYFIKNKYNIAFGTTSSSPQTGKFYDFLKNQGYHIKVIHISAPDDVRWDSIKERDKNFVQTTEKDVKDKGRMCFERINDTFLRFADEIQFFYRGEVKEEAQLAATWIRNTDSTEYLGILTVNNSKQYKNVVDLHNNTVNKLNKSELSWDQTVEKVSEIVYSKDN